jgi:hypothetical protein
MLGAMARIASARPAPLRSTKTCMLDQIVELCASKTSEGGWLARTTTTHQITEVSIYPGSVFC